jgi:hypothetical protein
MNSTKEIKNLWYRNLVWICESKFESRFLKFFKEYKSIYIYDYFFEKTLALKDLFFIFIILKKYFFIISVNLIKNNF